MAGLIIGLWFGLVVVNTVIMVVAVLAIKVQPPANAHPAVVNLNCYVPLLIHGLNNE